MRSNKLGVVQSLLASTMLFICGAANAADLPSRPLAPAALPVPPVYNWTGIYFGVNGGYGFGKQTPMSLYSGGFDAFDYSADGWLLGLTGGAQIQSGHVVIGIEGDFNWTGIKGSGTGLVTLNNAPIGTATISSSVASITTIRTRIGYASDNWLFYGTGGVAVTNATSNITTATFACGTAGNPSCASKFDLHLGLTAGAGFEYGITPNLSTKFEYLYVGAGAGNTLQENIVRAGLNYRFGM